MRGPTHAARRRCRIGKSGFALLVLVAAAALLCTGCGTMATGNGSLQTIKLYSTPPGATVTVDGREMGQTPTSVNLTRTEDHTVKFDLPGCPTHVVVLKHGPNQDVLKNFIFPGPPGFLVDAYSGAGEGALTPNVVTVTLEPAREAGYAQTQPASAPSPPPPPQ